MSILKIRSVKSYSAEKYIELDLTKRINLIYGQNGSGKSTAMNCILSLLSYDKGDIKVFGEEMKPTRYDL